MQLKASLMKTLCTHQFRIMFRRMQVMVTLHSALHDIHSLQRCMNVIFPTKQETNDSDRHQWSSDREWALGFVCNACFYIFYVAIETASDFLQVIHAHAAMTLEETSRARFSLNSRPLLFRRLTNVKRVKLFYLYRVLRSRQKKKKKEWHRCAN
jgi:hypothetical protein